MRFLHILTILLIMTLTASAYEFVGTINGEVSGDQFGSAIATVDFNADGYPDMVVSAPAADDAGLSSGKVYIYYGGPDADTIPDLHLVGTASSFFGQALSSAGDFNNDGYEDLLVGASFYDIPATSAGAVFLYYGGPSPDTAVDHIFQGEAGGDYFGTSVAGIEDFNNDGFNDIAIGAYRADWGTFTGSGKAYIYYGGTSPDFTADQVLVGAADGERFGYDIASGDFNGDLESDLAVGAYSYDTGEINVGRIYIFYGGSSPDSIPDMTITGDSAGYKFGWSLTTGLVNNDGDIDLVMGSDGVSIDTFSTGRTYVFYGGAGFDASPDDSFSLGRLQADLLGLDVASGVDINGDGFDEIVAGMPGNNDGSTDAGGAVVLAGGTSISVDTTVYGSSAFEESGEAVGMWPWYGSSTTFVVAVGAPSYNSFTGRLFVYSTAAPSVNNPPVINSVGDKFVAAGETLGFPVSASDPDGTIPSLSANNLPGGASFVDNQDGTGTFSWATAISDTGAYSVTFVASDGSLADSTTATITVIDTAGCCIVRGNVDHTGTEPNVSDLTYLVDYLFRGGSLPPCPAEGDVDGNGEINVSDLTYLIDFLFRGGSTPPPCPSR